MCLGCSKSKKVVKNLNSCTKLYNELVTLDLSVLKLYKDLKDPKLLTINNQLNSWISNLKYGCPPPDELDMLREIINQYEYPVD